MYNMQSIAIFIAVEKAFFICGLPNSVGVQGNT